MKEKMIKVFKRIFCLPPVLTLLIAIPAFGLVIAVLEGLIKNPLISYVAYVLSAYALIICVAGAGRVIKTVKAGFDKLTVVKKVLDVPVVGRLVRESVYRTEIALYPGFFINSAYAVFKMTMGIWYRSAWFISFGVYYLALAAMRFSLIRYIRTHKTNANYREELRIYRMCGWMLLVINAAVAGITVLAVVKNEGVAYPGYLIYVMAMYVFYSVIIAVVNLVKYRRYGSPVMSAAKVVNMQAALVAMFSLESAMLAEFGGGSSAGFRAIMTCLTGAGVCLTVLGMAVYMIVRAGRRLGEGGLYNRECGADCKK